jgi:YidC/Oxa1 family membrane protein insertase
VTHLLASSPLDPLYYAIGSVLAFFYTLIPSLGVATILLTLVVMAVQFPLIAKQTRSMIQMQRVQPEIKKIQQKYKDDRQKQNEELLKFYQENKINPLAGCLPLLVVFPIGIAVFRTFSQGVQRHIPQSGRLSNLYDAICTKGTVAQGYAKAAAHTPPVTIKSELGACNYALDHYAHGKTPPAFRFLGMNLNWSANEVRTQLPHDFVQWIPYFVLIGLVILTGWYQVRQTQARQQKQGGTPPPAQMQAITRIMPIFFGFITFGLNAATTLYFVVSNTWRIGQQHFVLNKFYEEHAPGAKAHSGPSDDGPQDELPPETGPQDKRPPGAQSGRPRQGGGAGGSTNGSSRHPASSAARRKRKRKR